MTRYVNRSTITFAVNETLGTIIVLHELILRDGERYSFLALAGALMGLPFILAADGKLTRTAPDKDEDEDMSMENRWSGLP